MPANTWEKTNVATLAPLIRGHYSRRRNATGKRKLGGIGKPMYLATPEGSAFIATLQGSSSWPSSWRSTPSWWNGLFRRHPADPLKASHLIRHAARLLQAQHAVPIFTAIGPAHTGNSFLYAGFRPWVCTRPFKRCRSLTIFVKMP